MGNQGARDESSVEDSKLMSSWRTGPEETEWSSERWRASLEPEVGLSNMEESEGTGGQEKEVEKEVEDAAEETML